MITAIDCIPCLVRQTVEALGFCVPDKSRQTNIMRELLTDLANADWAVTPATLAQRLHRKIRKETGSSDPYRSLKERMNRLALELLPFFMREALIEEDPRAAIVRMALAGNLIDAGAKTGLSETNIRDELSEACKDEVIGSVSDLFQAAEQARQILFLADNAGEIVFDRALIEILPTKKMFLGVRGAPVINDATLEDAEAAGLPGIVSVISNGSDAPGTVLEDCSADFRRIFETSDLVIAKGQGNYESLVGIPKNIFFLLRVKCPFVAAHIGMPMGAMVIHRQFA